MPTYHWGERDHGADRLMWLTNPERAYVSDAFA
jgi:hypothetical protein